MSYVHVHYPSYRYHPSEPPRLVHNAAQDDALGKEWRDTPYPAPDVPTQSVASADLETARVGAPPVNDAAAKAQEADDVRAAELYKAKVGDVAAQISAITSPEMIAQVRTLEARNPKGPRPGVIKALDARERELAK